MSKNDVTFNFDEFVEQVCSKSLTLKKSELYKFYSSLDGQAKNGPISEICNKPENEKLRDLCYRIEHIFKQWNTICSSSEQHKGKCCDYVNYWLYDKIEKKKDLKFSDVSWIYNRLKEILCKYSSGSNDKCICKDNIKIFTSTDVLKYKKLLYDFLEYYNYIINVQSTEEKIIEASSCEYIANMFSLYHKLEKEEEQQRKRGLLNRYENELVLFRKKFNDENTLSLLKTKCNTYSSYFEKPKSTENSNPLQGNNEESYTRQNISPGYEVYTAKIKSDYENVVRELPPSQIYEALSKEVSKEFRKGDSGINSKNYNYTYCDSLNKDIKTICEKMVRNINELSIIDKLNEENHRDRCTYLNFWIYDKIIELYENKNEYILDIPEVSNLFDANIKINNYLINEDFDKNYQHIVKQSPPRENKAKIGEQNADITSQNEVLSDNNGTHTLPYFRKFPEKKSDDHNGTKAKGDTERDAKGDVERSAGRHTDSSTRDSQTGSSDTKQVNKRPFMFVNSDELTKFKPCFLNYNCKIHECREMKHLYEYFKNHEEIKKKINCENMQNDKYIPYLEYISLLHKRHKDECCSWGAELCPSYFLHCDESYDPQKLLSALKSSTKEKCKEIIELIKHNESKNLTNFDPNSEKNMFIKYFTCSEVTHSNFEKSGLRCQQPSYSPHLINQHYPVRPVYKQQFNEEGLYGKEITINGKSVNAVLLTNAYVKIAGQNATGTSIVKTGYTLFPEVKGKARENYIKEAEIACANGTPKEGMEEYCKRSKGYNNQIKSASLKYKNIVQGNGAENMGEETFPIDTSYTNLILQILPFRIGVVILIALGAIFFTPFGSWLRYRIKGGRRKKKKIHYREPNEESSNYFQDYIPQHPPKKRINIVYKNS
ncbi:variable surface protein [Plasmodium gonderi]|uniref:Variable surface protein n=1 Tax=Plasmodium gonderi TaxID=77519 RepID=A0A1Y1JR39_PLAGO|nr:variable surface protein [Plasmodium gonderi]GAW83948.1 variable surface protein [Plasmodium gonderi]